MIDPDEDVPPRLDPPPEEAPDEVPQDPPDEASVPPGEASVPPGERLQRRVAVLIMVVTLLGAVFAFLQTTASNRTARATRRADTAAVEAMAQVATAASHISAEDRLWALAYEDAVTGFSLLASGDEVAAAAHFASRDALLTHSDLAAYQTAAGVDRARFVEEALAPSYRAAEYQKAYAAERDGWGAKGGAFVAMVTVLAVALFLLGLSRTSVAANSGTLLAGSGAALAAVAVVWGLVVLARPVPAASDEAIAAYVDGRVAFNALAWETDPGRLEEGMSRAEAAFTAALEARPGYFDAYLGRAAARFRLDFLGPAGPDGSEGARDDLVRALALNPLDAVAWGNLGAARFWLGDLEGAGEATRRALELDPDDLVFNMNLALFLTMEGDTAAFAEQWEAVAALATGDDMPAWLRTYAFAKFAEVVEEAAGRFPEQAAALAAFREQVVRLDHQIGVAKRFYGAGTPAPVATEAAAPAFTLSEDGTRLVATFAVTGAVEGQSWLWRTYRGGWEDATLSGEPQAWAFGVPDEPALTITLNPPGGFAAGVAVRVELFFEGSLVQAGEFTP
ncbi:MAG: Tetratricopeptide repeat [Acidobacteria bacterium]|nr:Tetratricopeptide repeat [Acidobacteriota bacterium]